MLRVGRASSSCNLGLLGVDLGLLPSCIVEGEELLLSSFVLVGLYIYGMDWRKC